MKDNVKGPFRDTTLTPFFSNKSTVDVAIHNVCADNIVARQTLPVW